MWTIGVASAAQTTSDILNVHSYPRTPCLCVCSSGHARPTRGEGGERTWGANGELISCLKICFLSTPHFSPSYAQMDQLQKMYFLLFRVHLVNKAPPGLKDPLGDR